MENRFKFRAWIHGGMDEGEPPFMTNVPQIEWDLFSGECRTKEIGVSVCDRGVRFPNLEELKKDIQIKHFCHQAEIFILSIRKTTESELKVICPDIYIKIKEDNING